MVHMVKTSSMEIHVRACSLMQIYIQLHVTSYDNFVILQELLDTFAKI